MHPPNHRPTETSFGESHQRDDFLGQEARNSRVVQRIRTIAKVAFVLMIVGLVALLVVGPGKAIDWLVNYLVPVGAITGVIIAALALLAWAVKRLPNPPYRNWWL